MAFRDRLLSERLDGGYLEDAKCRKWLEGDSNYDVDEIDTEHESEDTVTLPMRHNAISNRTFQKPIDLEDSQIFETTSSGFTRTTSAIYTATTITPSPGITTSQRTYQPNMSKPIDRRLQGLRYITNDSNELHKIHSDNDKQTLALRVFLRLDSQCLTEQAKKSFRDWQQNYARLAGCEALLPLGGSMVDEVRRESLASRAKEYFGGGSREADGKRMTAEQAGDILRRRGRSFGGVVWGKDGMNDENRRGSGAIFVGKKISVCGTGY